MNHRELTKKHVEDASSYLVVTFDKSGQINFDRHITDQLQFFLMREIALKQFTETLEMMLKRDEVAQ